MSLKKVLALLIALVMLIGVFAGCGGGKQQSGTESKDGTPVTTTESSAQEKQELVFWTLQQADINIQEAQQNAVKDFEAANNCKIDLTAFPYEELRDKMLAAVAAGHGPDLLLLDQIWVPQYAAAKFITPVDDLLNNSSIKADDYFPGAWGAGGYQGKTYAIPFDVGVWALLYYNKQMFKDAGLDPEKPPETWDEFLELGKKLTKDGKYGTAGYIGSDPCVEDAFIFSNGGKIVDDTGKKCLLNSEEAIEAMEFNKALLDISAPGMVGREQEAAFQLFTSGQVAMFFYGEWGQDTIKTRAPDMDYGVALLPRPKDGQSIGTFGGFNIGINANSKNKDLAWKFIEFATGKDAQMKITMLTPANKAAALEYLKEKRRYPDTIYQQLSTAYYRPLVPNYPEISEVQKAAIQKILLGEMSTKDALDEATKKIDELLNK